MKFSVMVACAIVALVVAIALGEGARAAEPMPLPDFDLTALDGSAVRSRDLASNGKWLMLYVQPNCRACDALLKVVTAAEFPPLAGRLVIIVGGGSTHDATSMSSRFPELAGAAWYADESRQASVEMKVTGAPVAIGVRQATIVWNFNGVLPDPIRMKSMLKSWIEG